MDLELCFSLMTEPSFIFEAIKPQTPVQSTASECFELLNFSLDLTAIFSLLCSLNTKNLRLKKLGFKSEVHHLIR